MQTGTALKISKGHMWRGSIEDKPGTFAATLEHLAKAGVNLQVVAGWAPTGSNLKQNASMEVFPITDEKAKQVAKAAGLQEMTDVVCLIVEGSDSPGLAHKMAKAIADAGVNTRYALMQSVKQAFLACFGFQNDSDAEKAKAALSKI